MSDTKSEIEKNFWVMNRVQVACFFFWLPSFLLLLATNSVPMFYVSWFFVLLGLSMMILKYVLYGPRKWKTDA